MAVGYVGGVVTACILLGAVAVRRYLHRYSAQSGLPMTIKTKMAKKKDGRETGMNAKNYMSTTNPLSWG